MVGRFITLEGGEGVGKSTQLAAIKQALESRGLRVVTTREPGGSAGAEAIRNLLLHDADAHLGNRAEALLFAAARGDHVEKLIRPVLARGDWVICDRFIDSSRAYQGGGGGLDDATILALHTIGSDGMMPDRTLLFDLPPAIATQRRATRQQHRADDHHDSIEARGNEYHARVASRFAAMAAAEPARFRTIDADGPTETVTQRAMDALADLLP